MFSWLSLADRLSMEAGSQRGFKDTSEPPDPVMRDERSL